MKKILIDTNALMSIGELKIDLFSELEKCCDFKFQLFVLEGTIKELEKIISEQRAKYRMAAKLALALLKAKNVAILTLEASSKDKDVDDLLVDFSKKGDLVLTQDIILKKRLAKPYLTIRQKKFIVIVK